MFKTIRLFHWDFPENKKTLLRGNQWKFQEVYLITIQLFPCGGGGQCNAKRVKMSRNFRELMIKSIANPGEDQLQKNQHSQDFLENI